MLYILYKYVVLATSYDVAYYYALLVTLLDLYTVQITFRAQFKQLEP